MQIHCACGHEYETRELPTPPGENPLVCRTDRASYTCEKCGAFNAPRLSEGVREEIGMGVMNVKSILDLDFAPLFRKEEPCDFCGSPHGDTCQHVERALAQAEKDAEVFTAAFTADLEKKP